MLADRILGEVSQVGKELISWQQLNVIREAEQTVGVAIWGTGKAGGYAVDICRKNGIQPVCVVDSFDHRNEDRFKGLPLISARKFLAEHAKALVVIACLYTYHIDKLLKGKNCLFFEFDTTLLNQCTAAESYCDILTSDRYKIEEVYNTLEDEMSKYVYAQIIKYRLSLDKTYIEGLNNQPIYFNNDVIPEFSGAVFLDCGAFVGDTLQLFHRAKSCNCKTYYALEPAHHTFERLNETIALEDIPYAVPMEIGAWDSEGILKFVDQNEGANHISERGEVNIHVNSLDNLFYGKKVDFIKMDIEGAERAALCGAKNIILDRFPILSFSIYHKATDLWELPLLVKSLSTDYRLYIRHHSRFGDDTVLYAIHN